MTLDPRTKYFLQDVRKQIEASAPKTLLSKVFGSSKPKLVSEQEEDLLNGVKVKDFEIGKLIGVGGGGSVFRTTDKDGNVLAMKIVAVPESQDEAAKVAFSREIKIGQTLDHPTIVKTIDNFSQGDAHFVIMEMVEGKTLSEVMTGPIPVESYLLLFEQLAEGLQSAHTAGVVHRDLKPENIMVNQEQKIKILDFGLARLLGDASATATGTFKGTIRYTSPEQLGDSKRAGPACDQFAFGLMSFEALTGKFAYEVDEKNAMKSMMARLTAEADRIDKVEPQFSESTGDVVAKMLACDPAARFDSIQLAFAELKATLT